jgi:1-deoxy-D-xylulose-5-phosphate synthase
VVLERVNCPADLRRLPEAELPELAREIREFIVEAVARTGGHLGSNLGAVELTLALHRVFDSPRDTLLWDTGHQAYVHKLVTGRRDCSTSCGRPVACRAIPRAESEHDIIENSHASTALSWAFGLACGQLLDVPSTTSGSRRRHGRRSADGRDGLRGPEQHRPRRVPVVIVLNDNGRSYAHDRLAAVLRGVEVPLLRSRYRGVAPARRPVLSNECPTPSASPTPASTR